MIYIGFDFSCNKPACCILKNNNYSFYFWPLELDNKSIDKLLQVGVIVDNRSRLPEIDKDSSQKFRFHLYMSDILSNKIISTLDKIIKKEKVNIAFEGSSFGSKGDAILQLSGYRYILANKLSNIYGLENIYTYAPLTIKSFAGCASRKNKGKEYMINAFSKKDINHEFNRVLKNNPDYLKKKTNYIPGIDDLIDSYFTLETHRARV